MEDSYPYITLDSAENDVFVHVPLVCDRALQVNQIIGKDGVSRPTIEFQNGGALFYDATVSHSFAVGGVEKLKITDDDIEAPEAYEPQNGNSMTTKGYVDSRTTADISLDEPVDVRAATKATLTTQRDANQHFDEEIKKRAVVLTISQDDYDAMNPEDFDPDTLYLVY